MPARVKPDKLAWLDLETTGLSYTEDQILEIGVIITDFDFNEMARFESVIQLTQAGKKRLQEGDGYVLNMHRENGLLQEAIHGPDRDPDLATAEKALVEFLSYQGTAKPGEYVMAGSGIAHFDHQMVQTQMSEAAKWFAYYVADVGIFRRMATYMLGTDNVPKYDASFNDGAKAHRALADAEAHLNEARTFKDWLKSKSGMGGYRDDTPY